MVPKWFLWAVLVGAVAEVAVGAYVTHLFWSALS